MLIEGSRIIRAKRKKLWKYLLDPKALEKTVPGIKRIKKEGKIYHAVLSLELGPFSGEYKGRLEIKKKKKPKSMSLVAMGSSEHNSLSARAKVRLSKANGATLVSYQSEINSGKIPFFVKGIIRRLSDKMISRFFDDLERLIISENP